ncbi:DUF4342 domain-containing protein [Saccharothrix sp. S26]|uniref:DUF4342 domain-containing protein n=1 Tax=Saccharothrix sp. S26 TaxID=2907215 RepID=UPI001F480F87|nr:DUF4342 domain-containing protein [Saccharothrix sp. S26]MCE6996149.1 DUF4342 domain-containing protein [Saccharothrix sp. S26]
MSEFKPESARAAVDAVIHAVRGLVGEGVNRRVVVRDSKEDVVLEVPVALGLVAALAAPVVTAIGTGVALIGNCGITIENRQQPGSAPTS